MTTQVYAPSGRDVNMPAGDGRRLLPLDMFTRRQWIVHRSKRPISPHTGGAASSTNPTTWGTYAEALAIVRRGDADGVGFVLTADDPYICVDLDKCRDVRTGEIEPWASDIIERLDSYAELSPSGTGVHVWLTGAYPGERHRTGHIEMYTAERYITMTFCPLPRHTTIRNATEELAAIYYEVFPEPVQTVSTPAPELSVDDRTLCDRVGRDAKGAALLAGDAGGYTSPSEARYALAGKLLFWTDDAAQIARVIRASGLFKPADSDRERDRKAANDAERARASYTGARYDPAYASGPRIVIPEPAPVADVAGDLDGLSVDELRAQLAAARRREAEKDALLARHREVLDGITTILASDSIEAGPRMTALGVLMVGLEKQIKGEKPAEVGYHMPASWIARRTGQTPKTVSGHLQKLAKRKVIDRTVRREKVRLREEYRDSATGEILTETRETNGQRNYIAFPENVVDFARRIANHQRTPEEEEAKHGGKRLACPDHPDAGTVTRHITQCRQCRKVLDERITHSGPPIGEVTGVSLEAGWESEPPARLPMPEPADTVVSVVASTDQDSGGPPARPCVDCGTPTPNTYRCDRCIVESQPRASGVAPVPLAAD